MEYFRFGEGKETFVILPGLSVQSVMPYADAVAEQYRLLSKDYTVYLFDRRKNLPDSYSVREMADDTAEAMNALGLSDICLFGASQGGMIALEIAVRRPEPVQKLILCSSAACVTENLAESIDLWISLAKEKDAEGLYLSFGERVYPPEIYAGSRELLKEAAKTVTEEDLIRFIILAEGIRGYDVTEDLRKLQCPVLAIGSYDDQVIGPEGTEQITRMLSGREGFVSHMYDGFGHAAYDTAPDYVKRIFDFLKPQEASHS